jgi:hypothetical protein
MGPLIYKPDFSEENFEESVLLGIDVNRKKRSIRMEFYFDKPHLGYDVELIIQGTKYDGDELKARRFMVDFKEVKRYKTDIFQIPYGGYFELLPLRKKTDFAKLLRNDLNRYLVQFAPSGRNAVEDWKRRRGNKKYIEQELYFDIICKEVEVKFLEKMNWQDFRIKEWRPGNKDIYFDPNFDKEKGFKEEFWD